MSGRRLRAALCAALLAALAAAPAAAGEGPIHIPKHPRPLSPTPPDTATTTDGTSTTAPTEIPRTGGEAGLTVLAGLGLVLAGAGLRLRAV